MDRRKVQQDGTSNDPGYWLDANSSGRERVDPMTGNTVKVIAECPSPWTDLPNLTLRGNFGDALVELTLDRELAFKLTGPRESLAVFIYDRVIYSQTRVTSDGRTRLASSLSYEEWLKLERFLLEALAYWPAIRDSDYLRKNGTKGAHTGLGRRSKSDALDLSEIRTIPLFYGGFRNGCWQEDVIKGIGRISSAPAIENAAKEQADLAAQDLPSGGWEFRIAPPSVVQQSEVRSLEYRGMIRTPEQGSLVHTSSVFVPYHLFQWRSRDVEFALRVDRTSSDLPLGRDLPSWRVTLLDSQLSGEHHAPQCLASDGALQDAFLNWRCSEILFGDAHRGPPIFLEMPIKAQGKRRLQVGRSSRFLRLFKDSEKLP